jgi:hypothetical protein
MSYLYKPVITVEAVEEREEEVKVLTDEVSPRLHQEKMTEITYEEHMKNLEFMCKTDREFMTRLRSFCEENKTKLGRDPTLPQSVIQEIMDDLNSEEDVSSEEE